MTTLQNDVLCNAVGTHSYVYKTIGSSLRIQAVGKRKWPRSVMDNAPDFGSGDCGFESHRGR